MIRILITGGSGFIGTNLIEKLVAREDLKLINIDIAKPKKKAHKTYWRHIDINDKDKLQREITEFAPNFVVHLAARTDLKGHSISDYNSNTIGLKNLIEILESIDSVKRVIFTSSMYVCEPGYLPKDYNDYAPHTIYGQSKVLTEKIIKNENPENYIWSIIRPTSIWGPWFSEPYADFFKIVTSKKYFHMNAKDCLKTYGYVGNTINQIIDILNSPSEKVSKETFYLGDWPEYKISEWANEIAEYNENKIRKLPFTFFQLLAIIGDILKIVGFKFPMTSFRLKNMTTDNVFNLEKIKKISPKLSYSRKQGTAITIEWMKQHA